MNLRKNGNSEYKNDPLNPQTMDGWMLANGQVGSAGLAMGVMGLTYSKPEINYIELKYKTLEGKIVSTKLQ